MVKTQLSITDKVGTMGAPTDWTLNVDEVRLYTGAKFIVPVCGSMFLMVLRLIVLGHEEI